MAAPAAAPAAIPCQATPSSFGAPASGAASLSSTVVAAAEAFRASTSFSRLSFA
uniref:Uncharacterized protein n=1 Tax=Triticum urartu TaxID=4572 RepID=A0A8R7PSS0_TRIUA